MVKGKIVESLAGSAYAPLSVKPHSESGGYRVSPGVMEVEMIDWDRVANLREEIGAADFGEVVDMFLEEADEVIARLRAGKPDPTPEAELHFLKGSALNLGFRELATLCSLGEKLAEAGGCANLGSVISSYAASRAAFEGGLRQTHAA